MLKVNENLKRLLQSLCFFSPKKSIFILHSKWLKDRGQVQFYQMCLFGHETNMDVPVESLLSLDKFSLKINNTPDKAFFASLLRRGHQNVGYGLKLIKNR